MTTRNLLALVLSTFLMAACMGPASPEETARVFWQSVQQDNAAEASNLSTLVDEAAFDGFERQWQGVDVKWGKVVIDDNQATVATTFTGLAGRTEPLETTTYLVRKDNRWLVDYYRTGDALDHGPLWGGVVSELESLGDDIRKELSRHSDDLAREFEALSEEFRQRANAAGENASGLVDEYGQILRKHLDGLSESIHEALKSNPDAPAEDRRRLNEAVIRLDDQSRELQHADFQSVADGTSVAMETELTLEQLGDEFAGYKAVWQQRLAEMERELANFVERLQNTK